eukprot:806295-Pyramimonas_sp.AAC.1
MIGASWGGAESSLDLLVACWRHPREPHVSATAPGCNAMSRILGPCQARMCHHFRGALGGQSGHCPREVYPLARATAVCCVQPTASPGDQRHVLRLLFVPRDGPFHGMVYAVVRHRRRPSTHRCVSP